MIERKEYSFPELLESPDFLESFLGDLTSAREQFTGALNMKEHRPEDFISQAMRTMHMLRGAAGSIRFDLAFDLAERVHRLCEVGSSFALNRKEDFRQIADFVASIDGLLAQMEVDLKATDISQSTAQINDFFALVEPAYGDYFYSNDSQDEGESDSGNVEHFEDFLSEFGDEELLNPVQPETPAQEAEAPLPVGFEPSIDDPVGEEMLKYFFEELDENMEGLERHLLALEKDPHNVESNKEVYRLAHSTKGAANSMGMRRIGILMHSLESVFDILREDPSRASQRFFSVSLQCCDLVMRLKSEAQSKSEDASLPSDCESINGQLIGLESSLTEDASGETTESATEVPQVDKTVAAPMDVPMPANTNGGNSFRVDQKLIDSLMDMIGELLISRNRMSLSLEEMTKYCRDLQDSRKNLNQVISGFAERFDYTTELSALRSALDKESASESEFTELQFDQYDDFNILSRRITEVGNDTDMTIRELVRSNQNLIQETATLGRYVSQIQENVSRARLAPVSLLFNRLDRSVRDACIAMKSEVRFMTSGGDTLLDRIILDELYNAFLHLVRNSVAHAFGPESEGNRIEITARQASGRIHFEIADNGGGLDMEKIRSAGVRKGLISEGETDESKIINLLFTAGFTTRDTVDEVAGRGVGMEVAKSTVERLGGSLRITSSSTGCMIHIDLPLTLSIDQGVFLTVGESKYVWPMNSVDRVARACDVEIKHEEGRVFFIDDDVLIPVYDMSNVFGVEPLPADEGALVIARMQDEQIAFKVHAVNYQQDVVIKSLGSLLGAHPLFTSATIDGNGAIVPIVDFAKLVNSLNIKHTHSVEIQTPLAPTAIKPRILIVDDSLSVRKICADYLGDLEVDVVTANDGIEAINCTRDQHFDLIFTDLEMPRLNGLELIPELRRRPSTSETPIVVISSRSSSKHVNQAISLGATQCISKPFSKKDIIEIANGALELIA
ncbi:response regulator [Cerasicoccus maritimus]|uniref:hybrid sensor histidine kinase/response regulator n=1 Tax=Cerasicoccus maritimus TaxID=490089 RepID=UPI00285271AE|nr:response regulator [Cerasicoccus maritimus]